MESKTAKRNDSVKNGLPRRGDQRQAVSLGGFGAANDFCRNAIAIRDSNDGVSGRWVGINLHSMSHVEDLIHFVFRRSARSFDSGKDGGRVEEVVLCDVSIVSKL